MALSTLTCLFIDGQDDLRVPLFISLVYFFVLFLGFPTGVVQWPLHSFHSFNWLISSSDKLESEWIHSFLHCSGRWERRKRRRNRKGRVSRSIFHRRPLCVPTGRSFFDQQTSWKPKLTAVDILNLHFFSAVLSAGLRHFLSYFFFIGNTFTAQSAPIHRQFQIFIESAISDRDKIQLAVSDFVNWNRFFHFFSFIYFFIFLHFF